MHSEFYILQRVLVSKITTASDFVQTEKLFLRVIIFDSYRVPLTRMDESREWIEKKKVRRFTWNSTVTHNILRRFFSPSYLILHHLRHIRYQSFERNTNKHIVLLYRCTVKITPDLNRSSQVESSFWSTYCMILPFLCCAFRVLSCKLAHCNNWTFTLARRQERSCNNAWFAVSPACNVFFTGSTMHIPILFEYHSFW